MTFQNLIKKALEKKPQAQLARDLETSQVTIWRWKNGICEPKPEAMDYWTKKIKRICK